MLQTRVIPVLLLRNNGLVKTIKFDKHKYIGDPINAVRIFNDKEVDELVFLDIDASKQQRSPDFELVKSIATECFMPFGYGGGISNMEQITQLFSLGVEKVIINSAALHNPQLISDAARVYGGQSIVVSVDVTKNLLGKYKIYSHANVKTAANDAIDFVKKMEQAGAGEIMLNVVDKDGMMNGYDLAIIKKISDEVNIPLVACGGAQNMLDLKKAADAGASGVAAGSMFVYHGPHKAVLINYPSYNDLKKLFTKNE